MVTTYGLFVINSRGELLCVHPTNHAVDYWSIPKGLMEDGETPLMAAIRETFEETNLKIDPKKGVIIELASQAYNSRRKVLKSFGVIGMPDS
jgi:8-oxo-dGTP pyrophosphatase MutT (NUDIX family)